MPRTPGKPILPPEPSRFARYFYDRYVEARDRLAQGAPVNVEQAKADWCAWQLAIKPPYVRPAVEVSAPSLPAAAGEAKPKEKKAEKILNDLFGYSK